MIVQGFWSSRGLGREAVDHRADNLHPNFNNSLRSQERARTGPTSDI